MSTINSVKIYEISTHVLRINIKHVKCLNNNCTMYTIHLYFYRCTSNCDESDEEQGTSDEVGVESTVDVEQGQGDGAVETITTPPHHLIAVELSETPPAKLKPSKAISLQETSK